jgi:hypothetical protein
MLPMHDSPVILVFAFTSLVEVQMLMKLYTDTVLNSSTSILLFCKLFFIYFSAHVDLKLWANQCQHPIGQVNLVVSKQIFSIFLLLPKCVLLFRDQ